MAEATGCTVVNLPAVETGQESGLTVKAVRSTLIRLSTNDGPLYLAERGQPGTGFDPDAEGQRLRPPHPLRGPHLPEAGYPGR